MFGSMLQHQQGSVGTNEQCVSFYTIGQILHFMDSIWRAGCVCICVYVVNAYHNFKSVPSVVM